MFRGHFVICTEFWHLFRLLELLAALRRAAAHRSHVHCVSTFMRTAILHALAKPLFFHVQMALMKSFFVPTQKNVNRCVLVPVPVPVRVLDLLLERECKCECIPATFELSLETNWPTRCPRAFSFSKPFDSWVWHILHIFRNSFWPGESLHLFRRNFSFFR